MSSLISIIVPIYNVEKYLPKCIESILNQTYTNLEIILVDDGSLDNSSQICDEYAKRDKRIKVIHQRNSGPGFTRNAGLDIYSGEFVMFIDPDDYISKDAVQVLYDRIVIDGSDMAVGKHTDVYDDGSCNGTYCSFMKNAVISKRDLFSMMGKSNFIAVSSCAKLYKRKIFDEIRYPKLKSAEDLWIFTKVVDKCKTISIVDKTIYYYYQRSDSLVHKKSEQSKNDELEATLYTVQFLWKRGYEASAKKWFSRGVSRALLFQKRKNVIKILEKYFDSSTRRELVKGQSVKTKFKWYSLYFPVIFKTVQILKQVTRKNVK